MKILFESRYTENSMDKGAQQAAVYVVTKTDTTEWINTFYTKVYYVIYTS